MNETIKNIKNKIEYMSKNPDVCRLIFEYKWIGFCSIFNVKNSHYEVEIWSHPEMETIEKFNIPYSNDEILYKYDAVKNNRNEVNKS